jgi:hypothetical protein
MVEDLMTRNDEIVSRGDVPCELSFEAKARVAISSAFLTRARTRETGTTYSPKMVSVSLSRRMSSQKWDAISCEELSWT